MLFSSVSSFEMHKSMKMENGRKKRLLDLQLQYALQIHTIRFRKPKITDFYMTDIELYLR